MTTSDQELCRRAARNDRAAFGALYERYADAVLSLLLARGAPQQTVWDLMQETFARALRAFDRGQLPDRFDLWIRRISLNVFADHWRRPYTQREESTDPHDMPEVGSDMADRDLATEMRALIQRLDPALRDVVILHLYQDLSVQDVASVLRVPAGTVKSRLSRAYRKLSQAMGLAERQASEPQLPRLQSDRPGPPRRVKPNLKGGRNEA